MLCVYREVALLNEAAPSASNDAVAIISCDEKPGVPIHMIGIGSSAMDSNRAPAFRLLRLGLPSSVLRGDRAAAQCIICRRGDFCRKSEPQTIYDVAVLIRRIQKVFESARILARDIASKSNHGAFFGDHSRQGCSMDLRAGGHGPHRCDCECTIRHACLRSFEAFDQRGNELAKKTSQRAGQRNAPNGSFRPSRASPRFLTMTDNNAAVVARMKQ